MPLSYKNKYFKIHPSHNKHFSKCHCAIKINSFQNATLSKCSHFKMPLYNTKQDTTVL